MKRLISCILLLLSMTGCGFLRETTYVAVSPHAEDYGVAEEDRMLTVNSYLGLKNAILSLVQDGEEDGVIRAESYTGNLSVDLSQAVYEVSQNTPLGAYAVGSMTYDYSRIVSYYEIHINTTYRRTREELEAVVYVADMEGLEAQLLEAMERYEARLVLRVGDYDAFDLGGRVEEIYQDHPEFALELPECTMELYPDSGSQRILEIKFTYAHRPEELMADREAMLEQVERLAVLYGGGNSQMTAARRLYDRLGRDALLERQESSRSLTGGAYGALLGGSATSGGFAQGYRLLLEQCGIPCQTVQGQRGGEPHDWCRLQLDGAWYYADPSLAAGGQRTAYFLMGDAELAENGYALWEDGMPMSELPAHLRPPPEPTAREEEDAAP